MELIYWYLQLHLEKYRADLIYNWHNQGLQKSNQKGESRAHLFKVLWKNLIIWEILNLFFNQYHHRSEPKCTNMQNNTWNIYCLPSVSFSLIRFSSQHKWFFSRPNIAPQQICSSLWSPFEAVIIFGTSLSLQHK